MATRRAFVRDAVLAGGAGLLGLRPHPTAAEPPPETTRLRLAELPSLCVAPQYIVKDLLKAEGFSDIQYIKTPVAAISKALASGEVDVSLHFVAPLVIQLDAGDPVTVLGRPAEALRQFEASQRREPDRLRGLYGAGQAAAQSGDIAKATHHFSRLVEIAGQGDPRPAVAQARAFLAATR